MNYLLAPRHIGKKDWIMTNVEKMMKRLETLKDTIDGIMRNVEEDCNEIIERERSEEWKQYAEEYQFDEDTLTYDACEVLYNAESYLYDFENSLGELYNLAYRPFEEVL